MASFLRSGRRFLFCVSVGAATNPLLAQRPTAATPMEQLRVEFNAARSPEPADLIGRWVQIVNINTERFLNGGRGPDHVDSDSTGLRGGQKGTELYWHMVISQRSNGKVVAASSTYWFSSDTTILHFRPDGNMMFSKETGGDRPYEYQCRVAGRRLICLLGLPNPGHAAVFLRMPQP